ncbi:PAS domain-containing protein [Gellertiella hungarica]|uniref:PAS domain-containing protein n=1 Tax=Gellertiella hungarica TaxID=1572859 RepID=A0A7W6J4X8_9HYPH|nr:PAS domain-containing protein [Gellertiella hungarica]MBB4064876.1 hypothetical protein [Gellertiella hungarica]
MELKISRDIVDYWNDIRGGRPAPLRAELKPAPISALLPDLFILQWDDSGEIVFRLAGTRVCLLMGKELRERSFTALWPPRQRAGIQGLVHQVAEHLRPVSLHVSGYRRELDPLHFEMVLLPVLEEGGQGCRVLGSFAPVQASAWQTLEPVSILQAEHIRAIGGRSGQSVSGSTISLRDGMLTAIRRLSPFGRKLPVNQ